MFNKGEDREKRSTKLNEKKSNENEEEMPKRSLQKRR